MMHGQKNIKFSKFVSENCSQTEVFTSITDKTPTHALFNQPCISLHALFNQPCISLHALFNQPCISLAC